MMVFGFSYTLILLLLCHLTVYLLCGLWRNRRALRSIRYPPHKELDNEGPSLGHSPNVSILVRTFYYFHRGANKMLLWKRFSAALKLSCILPLLTFRSVQLLSHVWLFEIPRTAAPQAPLPSPTPEACSNSCPSSQWCHPTILSNHLILCCPLLLLPSNFPSIRVFSNESVLPIRWPKYWSFNYSITPSNEHSGLISCKINWFDLLAFQRTLKSSPTPQFKSINSSVLNFLYSPTLTSIHDYWKNHCFD